MLRIMEACLCVCFYLFRWGFFLGQQVASSHGYCYNTGPERGKSGVQKLNKASAGILGYLMHIKGGKRRKHIGLSRRFGVCWCSALDRTRRSWEDREEKLIFGFLLLMKFEHTHAHLKKPQNSRLVHKCTFLQHRSSLERVCSFWS